MQVDVKGFKKVKDVYWYKHIKYLFLSLILSYIVIFFVGVSINAAKELSEANLVKKTAANHAMICEFDDEIFIVSRYSKYTFKKLNSHIMVEEQKTTESQYYYYHVGNKNQYGDFSKNYSFRHEKNAGKDGDKATEYEVYYYFIISGNLYNSNSFKECEIEVIDDDIIFDSDWYIEGFDSKPIEGKVIYEYNDPTYRSLPYPFPQGLSFILYLGQPPLFIHIICLILLIAMAVIAIMKKRIYVFVISLMILVYKLVLTLFYLGDSIKIFAAKGQETVFLLINVFSVIFVLTFLAKINKKYPSMIYGSDLYYQKLKTLEGADKANFVNGIEDSLSNDNIEEFARLLDLECEITNEEYKKQVEEGTYLEDNNGEIITDSRLLGASVSFFFFNFLCGILTVITFGIAYPFVVVMKEKYLAKRTYTTGHKNMFDGNGFQLIGKYILWLFLTVITFGIYSIFLIAKLIAWKTAHTHFFDSEVKESKYTGNGFVRYFLNIALTILAGITLGLAYPFKVCALQRYDKNNSIIDGYKLRFTGTAMQYFGKHIIWTLLSIVTIGIYYIFVPFKKQRWIREHTIIDETYPNNLQPKVEIKESKEIEAPLNETDSTVEANTNKNTGEESKENIIEENEPLEDSKTDENNEIIEEPKIKEIDEDTNQILEEKSEDNIETTKDNLEESNEKENIESIEENDEKLKDLSSKEENN